MKPQMYTLYIYIYIYNTEQIALEIRYYNGNCITEKFKSFIGCEHLSGESKANLIMDTLTKAELNIEI